MERVYLNLHVVGVELARGRLRWSARLSQDRPRTFDLSEPYTIALERYASDRRAAVLRVDKREALPVEGDRFTLARDRRVRRADGIIVSFDDVSHIHSHGNKPGENWTTGYIHLSIGPAGDPSRLIVEWLEGGDALGRVTWQNRLITIRSQSAEGLLVEISDAPPPAPKPEPPPPAPPPPRRPWWRFW